MESSTPAMQEPECESANKAVRPVAIATLHYGHNEGSVLQSYSLARAIERHLPSHRAEIIDHRYPSKIAIEKEPRGDRQLAIRRAVDTWLPLTPAQFLSESAEPAFEYVRRHCSAIVIGSDVLWRFRFHKAFGFFPIQRSGFHTPVPNVYWPDESVKVPRVSFAASVGSGNWKEMPFWIKRRLRRILAGFQALSVRDVRTLRFLEWLDKPLARRTALVPDPTWAFDVLPLVDAEALKTRLVAAGVDFSRPRCGFVAGPCESARQCAAELRRRGYQIIGITTPNDYSDVCLFDQGFHPTEWARLFGFMDIVVTERMHGAIYCIQNETPFVVLDINDPPGDRDTKIIDMLRGFGLERFLLPKATATAAQLVAACDDVRGAPWDWAAIRAQRARHRRTCDVFLERLKDLVPG